MSSPEISTQIPIGVQSESDQSPERIVAEVTRNWPTQNGAEDTLISQRFEHIIAVNAERGYQIESWQLHQVLCSSVLLETIIAVFKKVK